MHSSRMRTVRCSGRRGGSAPVHVGICLPGGQCLPQCMLGYVCPGGSAQCMLGYVCPCMLGYVCRGGVCPSACWDMSAQGVSAPVYAGIHTPTLCTE